MIFAPRSWPSRPGFAITTRIFRATSAVYGGAPDRHRLLAGLAEPGQRPLRATSSRPTAAGCCSTAARACSAGCASARGGPTSTRSRSRTSTSTTGATSSRGSGAACTSPRAPTTGGPSSGCHRAAARSSSSSARGSGFPDMFERTFDLREYDAETRRFDGGGLEVHADARSRTTASRRTAFRVTNGEPTLAYSGDSAPSERSSPSSPATPISSSARRRSSAASSTASRAATSALDEAVEAFEASGAQAPARSRTARRELPAPDGARARLRRARARGLRRSLAHVR